MAGFGKKSFFVQKNREKCLVTRTMFKISKKSDTKIGTNTDSDTDKISSRSDENCSSSKKSRVKKCSFKNKVLNV